MGNREKNTCIKKEGNMGRADKEYGEAKLKL